MRVNQALSRLAKQKMLIPVKVLIDDDSQSVYVLQERPYGIWRDVRSNVLGEPFPHKDPDEYRPEELDSLLLEHNLLSAMQSIEELDGWQQIGEDDVGGVHEERAHETPNTVSHQLRT